MNKVIDHELSIINHNSPSLTIINHINEPSLTMAMKHVDPVFEQRHARCCAVLRAAQGIEVKNAPWREKRVPVEPRRGPETVGSSHQRYRAAKKSQKSTNNSSNKAVPVS